MTTNQTTNQTQQNNETKKVPEKDDSALERIARKIAPPGHEPTDEDLKNPGAMTPDAAPTDNRS